MVATVALWPNSTGVCAPPLAEVEKALKEPVFALYLGRKSCPPSRSLFPLLIIEEGIRAAFRNYDDRDATAAASALPAKNNVICRMVCEALAVKAGREIWADRDATAESERKETYSRRDAIRDRRSWTFSERPEARIDDGRGSDVSLAG
jgi:CRISPR system Cascade subunit CasD